MTVRQAGRRPGVIVFSLDTALPWGSALFDGVAGTDNEYPVAPGHHFGPRHSMSPTEPLVHPSRMRP